MPDQVRVDVKGQAGLARAFRRAGRDDVVVAIREANRAGAELVASAARGRAPRRSGSLAGSIRVSGSERAGMVRVGSARVPYAGPIHFGWPRRNIAPQPFLYDTLDARRAAILKIYEERLDRLTASMSTSGD